MKKLALLLLAACGGNAATLDASPDGPSNTSDWDRDVTDTGLAFDLATQEATATITIAGSTTSAAASFETGDLTIESVTDTNGAPLDYTNMASELDVRIPPSTTPATIVVTYHWQYHGGFMGAEDSPAFTLDWPYYCGNLFPCKNKQTPADGTRFTLALTGVPADQVAVYPTEIPAEAPDYQLAWAISDFEQLDLGTTTDGTAVSIWHIPLDAGRASQGGAHLVAAFDWLEQHLGPYLFGDHVGAVGVAWPAGAYGGMEHHPYWHVARNALSDESVLIHEASHGWYGDGIRLRCWEDFVLSEGTVSYLEAHVYGAVAGAAAEQTVWDGYASRLGSITPQVTWPDSCGAVDVLTIFNDGPYIRGAYFYKAVADHIGADVLDTILHDFYMAHRGQAAGMQDMLDAIDAGSGWDPTACAQKWLRDEAIPTVQSCD